MRILSKVLFHFNFFLDNNNVFLAKLITGDTPHSDSITTTMIINELKYPWLAIAAISGWSSGGHQYLPANNNTSTSTSTSTSTNNNEIDDSCQEFAPAADYRLEGWSFEGKETILAARAELQEHGAVAFPNFLTQTAVAKAVEDMRSREDDAFTTNTEHTAYLKHLDTDKYPLHSIYNHPTKTIVASTAYDELPENSVLKELYTDPRLLKMVASIVLPEDSQNQQQLFLSEDPLGCCSVNVFRPGYYHGFHYDESEFSVTLMLQDAEDPGSGLFQYTDPIRQKKAPAQTNKIDSTESSDVAESDLTLELKRTADVFRDHEHDRGASSSEINTTTTTTNNNNNTKTFAEHEAVDELVAPTILHTLDFSPGNLLVLAGSRSLHRVTAVKGNRSRFVAVLTFASKPGFCNTPKVQEMFWGRTAARTSEPKRECGIVESV